jgi:Tfp pilus assembly protein PilF
VVLLLMHCFYGLPSAGGGPARPPPQQGSHPQAYDRVGLLQRADRLRKVDNRPTEALALYREVLRREGGADPDALGGAAAVLLARRSTLPEARELLRAALRIAPTDARALHALGVAEWTESHNATAAAAWFARAVALDPVHARARCAWASMLQERGDAKRAQEVMDETVRLLPSSAGVAGDYGVLLAERPCANLTEAEALFRRARQLDPSSAMQLYNHAQLRALLGDANSTENLLRRAFSLQPEDTHTLCALARLMAMRDNVLAARRLLERALALDPQCGAALLELARLPADDHNADPAQHAPQPGELYRRAAQEFEDTCHPDARGGQNGIYMFSKALYIVTLHSKYTWALNLENFSSPSRRRPLRPRTRPPHGPQEQPDESP